MKFIKKIAFVAAAVCAALLISCSNDAGGGSSGGESGGKPSVTVTLNKTSAAFKTGETVQLTATVTGSTDAVQWSTTNSQVAAVSGTGNTVTVTGGSTAGDAVIKASVGTVSASCSVTCTGSVSPSDVIDIDVVPNTSVTTYGWADMANSGSGMSYPNTTNIIYIGDDGYKVGSGSLTAYSSSVTKRSAFTNAIASGSVTNNKAGTTAAIIVLSGTIDLSDGKISDSDHSYYNAFDDTTHARLHDDTAVTFQMGSNKTIIGVNNAKIAFGGIKISGKENIIIRNVTFWDAHGSTEYDTSAEGTYTDGSKTKKYSDSKASIDALGVESVTNLWVDHCKFTDGSCIDLSRNFNHDGAFDIKNGKCVTVSYCEFTNHDKIMLIAPGDSYTTPEERQITLHHNYFYGATQRMPRSRGCQMHIYNNYWNDIGNSDNVGYSLGPGIGSQYIVENNYFGNFADNSSIVEYFDSSADSASTLSKFYQSGNNITITAANVRWDSSTEPNGNFARHNTSTKPWTISYTYTTKMDSYDVAKSKASAGAGPDKTGYSKNVRVNSVKY